MLRVRMACGIVASDMFVDNEKLFAILRVLFYFN